MSNSTIPEQFKEYLDHGASKDLYTCKGCGSIPMHCENITINDSSKFISLSCTSSECRGKSTWFVCCLCDRRFPRYSKAESHIATKKHQEAASKQSQENPKPCPNSNNELAFDNAQSNFFPVNDSQESGLFSTFEFSPELGVESDDDDNNIFSHDGFDESSTTVPTEVAAAESVLDAGMSSEEDLAAGRKALGSRHEWLADMLKDVPKATENEVFKSLQCSPNMQRFWLAEHSSPGGGLIYLVGRAFSRSTFVGPQNLPDLPEAEWQMQNFMQYMSMSERQRDWHAEITLKITSTGSNLIKKTRIPNPQELKRFYKGDSQHSIWNALPTPTIHNINGIAYVNPEDIVRFAFASGLEFDDIWVSRESETGNHTGKQYHVADSQKIRNCMKQLQLCQDEKGDYNIVISWLSDWRDGFGVNRTKNNRKSVVAWTLSVSPGKSSVNSVDNTFAMALGQKKNSAWSEVEHRVRKDTAVFNDPNKPLEVYHGGTRKMVRVFVKRICTTHDKPERADITGTLSYNGNTHRSFGRLIHIVSPSCDTKKVKEFLGAAEPNQSNGIVNRLEWGWSDKMLNWNQGIVNGAILPACCFCRAKNIYDIMGSFPMVNGGNSNVLAPNYGPCPTCANWTMDSTTSAKLPFKAPADYPTTCAPNCPVEPPLGRCTTAASLTRIASPDTGKEENFLHLKDLEFPDLVKACKFAFFNLVSGKPWTLSMAKAYLTSNGIAPKYGTELCRIAKEAKKAGRAENVCYNDPERIDEFEFAAAWIDPNLSVKDFIETIMHELFLGVAESNFELCSLWNKERNRDTAFRRNAQELLQELKKFGLNWLHTYPFSAGDDPKKAANNYGTGAWQSENWIAWVRITKILYLQVTVPSSTKSPKTTGNGDVLRLVIAFTALAARAMSHSGIEKADINEFGLYLKEFFSCVRELDIQTRHSEMDTKRKRVPDPEEPTGADPPLEGPGLIGSTAASSGKEAGNNGKKSGSKPKDSKSSSHKKKVSSKKKRIASSTGPKPKKRKTAADDNDSDYVENEATVSTRDSRTTKSPTKSVARGQKAKRKKVSNSTADQDRSNKRPTRGNKPSTDNKGKKKAKIETTGGGEAWWTKANYLSLPNLVEMMEVFGLLINYWDGGGKGEKFVQEVKPLITRGVHDYESFFPLIMEKLYKFRLLDIFRAMYSLFGSNPLSLLELSEGERPRFSIGTDGEIRSHEDLAELIDSDAKEEVTSGLPTVLPEAQDYSPMEDVHMAKHKTFYCYRSEEQLDTAIEEKKPISGILVLNEANPAQLDFHVLHIRKRKYYWKKIGFDDAEGVLVGGLWYAPINMTEATQPIPEDFNAIQNLAKMSTVAIPMSFGIGQDKPDSNKYCVITNWWKERQSNGRYTKPGLDPNYYLRRDNYEEILERLSDATGRVI